MFSVPKWGDDVPKNNEEFTNLLKSKKKNKPNSPKLKVKKIVPKPVKLKKPNVAQYKKETFKGPQRTQQYKKPVKKSFEQSPQRNNYNNISNDNVQKYNNKSPVKKTRKSPKKSNVSPVNEKPIKRKRKDDTVKTKNKNEMEDENLGDLDLNTDKIDEVICNKKKRKLSEKFKKEVEEESLLKKMKTPVNSKKETLKKILELNNRNAVKVSSKSLRGRMLERLKAAQFRFLNEKLYTSSGSDAQQLFQNDPQAFTTYHQGYQQQVKKWPVNPLDVIVKRINKMPKSYLIADMGCGEAALSRRVSHTVRSFDLVAVNPAVEACDMAHTPLLATSMDVVVYCLALMGTDLTQYLVEANRVLRQGGHLLIAEVESRFGKVDDFTKEVQRLGFKLKTLDKSQTVFFFMEFSKVTDAPKKSKLPRISLKPCFYKRR